MGITAFNHSIAAKSALSDAPTYPLASLLLRPASVTPSSRITQRLAAHRVRRTSTLHRHVPLRRQLSDPILLRPKCSGRLEIRRCALRPAHRLHLGPRLLPGRQPTRLPSRFQLGQQGPYLRDCAEWTVAGPPCLWTLSAGAECRFLKRWNKDCLCGRGQER